MRKTGNNDYYKEYYNKHKKEHRERVNKHVKENKEYYQEQNREYKKIHNQKIKDLPEDEKEILRKKWCEDKKKYRKTKIKFVNEYKVNCSCNKCGDGRAWVLDFHHKNPKTKKFNIADRSKHSISNIKLEIEKCIILCKNCHSDFHYFEKEKGITINEYLENEGK